MLFNANNRTNILIYLAFTIFFSKKFQLTMSHFGKNIKKLRSIKQLSQSKFAELFDLKRASIGAYEEERAEPKTEVIIRIARYFNLSLDDLLAKDLSVNQLSGFELKTEATDFSNKISNKEPGSTKEISISNKLFDQLHHFDPSNSYESQILDNLLRNIKSEEYKLAIFITCFMQENKNACLYWIAQTNLNTKELINLLQTIRPLIGLSKSTFLKSLIEEIK